MEALIGVDVPNPSEDLLVQEGGLHRSLRATQALMELIREDLEGIWAMLGPILLPQEFDRLHWRDTSESPWVLPTQPSSRGTIRGFQLPGHMAVFGCIRARGGLFKNELARHAEAEFENTSILDLECEAFAMSVYGVDSAVSQQGDRTCSPGDWDLNDIRPAHTNTTHHHPKYVVGESLSDLLDFRQFWHR